MKRITFTESNMVETLTDISPKPMGFSGQPFNFCELDDRIFEILLYQIFKSRIEMDDFTLKGLFDNVILMQGVGERGRDCFLTKNGKNIGVIQCKKISKNINQPDAFREILKFIIHYTQDKTLIYDVNNFYYYFAVSKGFAETASNFLADFNNNYIEANVENICNSIIESYAAFKNVKYDDIAKEIKEVIEKINVRMILPSDLSQYLSEHEKLIRNFFRVLTVTDNSLLEGIIENYLSPILNQLYNKKDSKDFTFRFKEYLQRVYSYYSSSRTLVFGNQQKKLEDFYYPLTIECMLDLEREKKIAINTSKYEDSFLPQYKKTIIVDNGGMGKSTIMKWLFLSVIKQRKGIPIFIELRKLIGGKTVIDEIIQELNPLDENLERDMVTKIIANGNFIFFFDGYDEIREDDRSFVTTDLQNFISKSSNNLFIMTSRPETALNAFSDFKEFKVKKLSKKEAFELIKKIGNNSDKSQRLIKKIQENDIENIDDFLESPLLVSLLYKKFEHRENLPLKLQEFYYDVFEALFQDHDLTKGDSFIRSKKSKLSFSEFFQVLREFSFFTLKKNEIEYNDAVLSKYINEVSKRLPHIKFKIENFIEDLVKTVPLFNKEGLQYRWSHKSFQEYFAAEFICRDTKDKQIELLRAMSKSDKCEKLLFVFSLCYDIDYNSFTKAITIPYLRSFIDYYENSFIELYSLENLDVKKVEVRKAITFNQSYLIILKRETKNTREFIEEVFNYFQKKENNFQKIFPDFFPENYTLNYVIFGEIIIMKAVHKNDFTSFFTKKKEVFMTKITAKQNLTVEKVFKDIEIPDFIVINEKVDSTNSSNIMLDYFNQVICKQNSTDGNYYLDYKKIIKYVSNFEKKELSEESDYFTNGF